MVRMELAVGATSAGEKEQTAPEGQLEVESATALEKPAMLVKDIVWTELAPYSRMRLVGTAEIEKSGDEGQETVTAIGSPELEQFALFSKTQLPAKSKT